MINKCGRTVRRLSVYTTTRLRLCIALVLLSTLCWLSYNVIFVIHNDDKIQNKRLLGFLVPPQEIDNSHPFSDHNKYNTKRKDKVVFGFSNSGRIGSDITGENNNNNAINKLIPPTAHHQDLHSNHHIYNPKKLRHIDALDELGGLTLTDGIELFPPDRLISGLGDGGQPAQLPETLQSESMEHFDDNSFNVVLSDHMSLNRKLKDHRGEM